uniref:Uncharacterized protein n=1 Tax=Kwoniella pini CBS 10737 TaxID=1296096 RepID=A0A1B9I8U8_9TREE|nr:uncharacterized protein I206_01306 [Kwoniella pini CBS 10737]OCF52022.1 hypothetical protein I206_01306 [Kwoniella pini CBS 10737]
MTSEIPTIMKAVVEDQAATWVEIKQTSIPEPGDNEVLIKVEYSAQPKTPDTNMIIPVVPELAVFGKEYLSRTAKLISSNGLRANPIDLRNGLESISQGL